MELREESLRFKSYQINTQRRGHSGEKGRTPPPNKTKKTKQNSSWKRRPQLIRSLCHRPS